MSGRAATDSIIPGLHALSVGPAEMAVPDHWEQVGLLDIARLESGHTPSRKHPEWWGGDIPWISIPDARDNHGQVITVTKSTTNEDGLANSAARWLPKGTVCLSRTASVGYVTVLGRPMATSQDFVNWICSEAIDPHWLKHLFIAENYALKNRFGKGSTHTTIYFPEVKAFHVCLPPLNEQRRIVARIESLQARSEAAKEALDAIPPLLEKFRQSVLAAAFRGDLTASWRAKNPDVEPASVLLERIETPPRPSRYKSRSNAVQMGISGLSVGHPERPTPPGWSWVPLVDVAQLASGHTPSRRHPEWWGGDVHWIGIADAREHHGGTINQTSQQTNPEGLANSAARLLPKGTVCLSRTASVGYVVVMGREMATSQDFVNWTCTEAIEPEWLKYLFMAENRSLWRFAKGSTHSTIYFPEVLSFHVCLPPIEEQREIVAAVRERLVAAARIESVARLAKEKWTQIDPSILAKAFRGELVPQDPTDEPASVLLERIRAEREAAEAAKKAAKKKGRGKT